MKDKQRAFEYAWHRVDSIFDIRALLAACCGWTLRYQSWDITAGIPSLQGEYTEALNTDEVRSQVHNFVSKSPEAAAARTQHGFGVQLMFPSVINPHDLDVFMVLRTVYRLQGRIDPVFPSLAFRSLVIPLDWITDRESARNPGGHPADPALAKSQPKSKLAYSYGFEFARNSTFLLYHDTATMSLLPKGTKLAKTLVAFDAPLLCGLREASQPARFLGTLECAENEYFGAWGLHPTLPILAVDRRNLDKPAEIVLWDPQEEGMKAT